MKPQNISALCLAAVLSLLTASCATTSATPKKFSGATPLEWSQRLAASQIVRHQFTPKWDYTVGLFSLSLLKLNEQASDSSYQKFAEAAVGSLIAPDGNIQGYKVESDACSFNFSNDSENKPTV